MSERSVGPVPVTVTSLVSGPSTASFTAVSVTSPVLVLSPALKVSVSPPAQREVCRRGRVHGRRRQRDRDIGARLMTQRGRHIHRLALVDRAVRQRQGHHRRIVVRRWSASAWPPQSCPAGHSCPPLLSPSPSCPGCRDRCSPPSESRHRAGAGLVTGRKGQRLPAQRKVCRRGRRRGFRRHRHRDSGARRMTQRGRHRAHPAVLADRGWRQYQRQRRRIVGVGDGQQDGLRGRGRALRDRQPPRSPSRPARR